MTATSSSNTTQSTLEQIHALLAAKRYAVTESGDGVLRIQEVDSGIVLQAVLAGEILFLSLVCMTVPAAGLTPSILRKMLAADNGISTSYFQLYDTGDLNVAITLNNFCKLQPGTGIPGAIGPEDEDDILSCVSFLLADVVHAKELIGADLHSA